MAAVTDEELGELIRRHGEAVVAFMRADMERYFALVNWADGSTLLPPLGGVSRHDAAVSPEDLAALKRTFKGGEAELEVVAAHASGDLAVLVTVERQHGVVGDLPPQDLSLRVTVVYRREGGAWRLVHRHADPLVRRIGFGQLGALARG